MPAGLTYLDYALLIAAGLAALGGVSAAILARSKAVRSRFKAARLGRLSEPTCAVVGAAGVVFASLLASPVFGWAGAKGPMGALAILAVVAAIGSVALDLKHNDDDAEDES